MGRMRGEEVEIVAVNSKISLIRLREGGAAMLKMEKRNHHNMIEGEIERRPFIKNNLRVLEKEYIIPANKKRAEEHKP